MSKDAEAIALATELTMAWLANPNTRVSSDDVPAFLASMHQALGRLSSAGSAPAPEPASSERVSAMTARKSLAMPGRIISMIDGKSYASLKRHLREHGLTPDEYRARYGLKPDYPMVAPEYSAERRAFAKQHGFGRTSGRSGEAPAPQAAEPAEPANTSGRKRLGIAGAKAAAKTHLEGAEDA